jgi:hypothetical protein
MITYTALLETAYGVPLGRFDRVYSIQAARAFNTVGSTTLLVPDTYGPELWHRDLRVKLYRSINNGPRYLLGNTVWFMRSFKWLHNQKKWQISGKDALSILERSLVAYTSDTLYADKTIDNGNSDTSDNLMKAFLRENIGSLAQNTARDLSAYVTIEDDLSYAAVTEKTAAGRDLFSVLNELVNDALANGVKLVFDLVPNSDGTFRFRVFKNYLGVSRPNVIFSPAFRNITDVEINYEYANEVTVARVGGEGQDADRLITEVKDDARIVQSPFGRIEKFVDDKDIDSVTVLQADGNAYLAKYTPRITLDGKLIDTPQLVFGRDYFYGDSVTSAVDNLNFPCVFDTFNLTFENGVETLDLKLHGEL